MRALYPKPRLLPSLLLLTLGACEPHQSPEQQAPPAPAWSDADEALFQEAEALKHALQQQELEAQRLREAGLPEHPPTPR